MNKAEVKDFLREQTEKRIKLLGIDNVSFGNETDLVKEGIFDSLSFVDLIADCEAKFRVQIDLEKYEPGQFTKAGKLIDIIAEAPKS